MTETVSTVSFPHTIHAASGLFAPRFAEPVSLLLAQKTAGGIVLDAENM